MPFTGTEQQMATLRTELLTDPRSYGYGPLLTARNFVGASDLLNLPRTAANGGPNGGAGTAITIRKGVRTGIDVMNCIAVADFAGRTVGQQQYILALVTPVEGVDLSNDVVRASLAAIFPTGNATRDRLLAAADKTPASRAEELFGLDSRINPDPVEQAVA